jgi:hypothetical protein
MHREEVGHMGTSPSAAYRVPATATFHLVTVGLAVVGVALLQWSFGERDYWLALPAGLLVVLAAMRLRSRVVVTPQAVRVTGELVTTIIELDDVSRVEAARDRTGWTTKLVRRDGTTCRVLVLSSFSHENTRLAADELSIAIDEMRQRR